MGIADLTGSIIDQAHDQADAILSKADEEVRKIDEETEVLVKKKKMQIEKSLEQERDIQVRKMDAEIHLLETQERLVCKQEQIDLAFEEAWQRISKMGSTERKKYLQTRESQARAALGNNIVILCAKPDAKLMKSSGKSRETIDSAGGFIARSKDGKVELDCTFERRLEEVRQKLTPEIARFLFEQTPAIREKNIASTRKKATRKR